MLYQAMELVLGNTQVSSAIYYVHVCKLHRDKETDAGSLSWYKHHNLHQVAAPTFLTVLVNNLDQWPQGGTFIIKYCITTR